MTENVRQILSSVKSLLGGIAAFMVGDSLLGVVLPIRMEAAGYPVALTGAIMAAYYACLALGGMIGSCDGASKSRSRCRAGALTSG